MKKILIVDDSEAMIELLQKVLQDAGFEVIVAKNGWDGLEKANEYIPHLIISDFLMSGLDGFNFIKLLKKYPIINKIPIIFLSGNVDVLSINEGIELGASAFLTKPVQSKELINTINSML